MYNIPESIAIEIACWDIIAQKSEVPLYRLLGGQGERKSVPIAGYCFFRGPDQNGNGAVTPDNFVQHCLDIQSEGDFSVLKLKFGANRPEIEVELAGKLREAIGNQIGLRADPNGSWSLPTALRMLKRLELLDLEYIEEPIRVQGPADSTTATNILKRLRNISKTPIAADHCYRIDLLTQIVRDDAADLILADVFGSGGIEATVNFCRIAAAFGLDVVMHSGTELCVGQVVKLHIQAALSDLVAHASDAIYPEYVDGVLEGGKLGIREGMMDVPQNLGLGIRLDDEKLAKWELTAEYHRQLDIF